ncbi:MAG: hypothetical protein PHD54_16070 [Desulfuromonadaceae bacterium]|nr:hypothetical protein [Desulfuromonadaceae bacterium]
MKMGFSRVIGMLMVLVIMISTVGTATIFAAEKDNAQKDETAMNLQDIKDKLKQKPGEYKIDGFDVTIVTDSNDLNTLMKDFNAEAPKTKRIQRIELYETVASPSVDNKGSSSEVITPKGWGSLGYFIKSVTDRGYGWYFPGSPYRDDWWDGPDTAQLSLTASISATKDFDFGLSLDYISGKVGFSMTSAYSVTISSTTPVPAGYTLNLKTYITYQRKDCEIWENFLIGDDEYAGTGSAYKPMGTYFAKFWYC